MDRKVSNFRVLHICLIVPFNHYMRSTDVNDGPGFVCVRVELAPHCNQESPYPTGAAYLKPRLLSKLQTLRTRRDAQGQRNTRVDLGLALGKGCRRERLLISYVSPTMEMLGALLDPVLNSRPHPLWTVELSAPAFYWSTLLSAPGRGNGNLEAWFTLTNTQKVPKTASMMKTLLHIQLPQPCCEGCPNLLIVAIWKAQPCGALKNSPLIVAMTVHISPEPWTPDVSYIRGFQVF